MIQKPIIEAHRGDSSIAPENTLAAYQKGFDEGADILETDLHLSADGEFVCIHDKTVDRTTDGSGAVSEKTLADLKKLSAFNGFEDYRDQRIPTLKETAEILPADVGFALELKTDRFLELEVCRKLVSELVEYGIFNRTIILSFSLSRMETVKAVEPSIPMGWITMARFRPDPIPEVLGPFWPALFLNPFFAARAHKRGQLVCPLDPTPDSRLWYYKFMKCDALVTDDPGATLKELRRISFKYSNNSN
jgi:glycerophosphoryl diester phosphodiesterase